MIVRASENLLSIVKDTVGNQKQLSASVPIKVWDGNNLITPQNISKSEEVEINNNNNFKKFIPEWMLNSLLFGNILSIDINEYYMLHEKIRSELEILSNYL